MDKDALWNACLEWVNKNQVRAPESIYQVDSVAVALFDLGEIVCDHVGFYRDQDENSTTG